MSNTVSKSTFISEVDPWDEGPHTLYQVYHHVSDSATFYIKTRKAGRWIPTLSADDALMGAIMKCDEEVHGDERAEVMRMDSELHGSEQLARDKSAATEVLLSWFVANAERVREGFEGKVFVEPIAVRVFPEKLLPAFQETFAPIGEQRTVEVVYNVVDKRYVSLKGFGVLVYIPTA